MSDAENDRRLATAVHAALAAAQRAIDAAREAGLAVDVNNGFTGSGPLGAHVDRIIPRILIQYPPEDTAHAGPDAPPEFDDQFADP